MAPKRNDGRAAYLETEPPRRTAARLSARAAMHSRSSRPPPPPVRPPQLFSPLVSTDCFPEVRWRVRLLAHCDGQHAPGLAHKHASPRNAHIAAGAPTSSHLHPRLCRPCRACRRHAPSVRARAATARARARAAPLLDRQVQVRTRKASAVPERSGTAEQGERSPRRSKARSQSRN